MDANTAAVLRVLITSAFLASLAWATAWALVKIHAQGESTMRSVLDSEQPTWTYRTTWTSGDLDDFLYDEEDEWNDVAWLAERQQLRDRLARALWRNRNLERQLRQVPSLDNQVQWRLNEAVRKIQTWEGEL